MFLYDKQSYKSEFTIFKDCVDEVKRFKEKIKSFPLEDGAVLV